MIELINLYRRACKTALACLRYFLVAHMYICHHVYTKTATLINGQCNLLWFITSSHNRAATLCSTWFVFLTSCITGLPYNMDRKACHYVNDKVNIYLFCLRCTVWCTVPCACTFFSLTCVCSLLLWQLVFRFARWSFYVLTI